MKIFFNDTHPLTDRPLSEADKIMFAAEREMGRLRQKRNSSRTSVPVLLAPMDLPELAAPKPEPTTPALRGANLLKYSDPEDVKICVLQLGAAHRLLMDGIQRYFGLLSTKANFIRHGDIVKLVWAYVSDTVNRRLLWHRDFQKDFRCVIGGSLFHETLEVFYPEILGVHRAVQENIYIGFHEEVLLPFWELIDQQIDRLIPKATWQTFLVLTNETKTVDQTTIYRPELYVGSDYRVVAWNVNQE